MSIEQEKLQGASSALKMVYKSQNTGEGIHRNILRKQLLSSGKISSKTKFTPLLESLIALGKLKVEKDIISINPDIIQVCLLQKENEQYFVVLPNSQKHFAIEKSIAAGYAPGDVLDVIIEYHNSQPEILVLGKSKQELAKQTPHSKPKTTPTSKPQQHTQNSYNKQPTQSQPMPDNCLLGRVVKISHDNLVFIPNRRDVPARHIPILNKQEEWASFEGRICVISLKDLNAPAMGGDIVQIHGIAGNPIHEIEAIAKFYNSINNWDAPAVKEEIKNLPTKVDVSALSLISEEDAQISQRGKTVDLRHIPFATVDPNDCKDMDDAIYSTIDENGDIVCYSAISNITKYFSPDSEIAKIYFDRAFTLYTPNYAYGITPNQLSTNICSLTEGEDRLALVVKTIIDRKTGVAKESYIYDAIIQSRKKYSYEETQEITDSLSKT